MGLGRRQRPYLIGKHLPDYPNREAAKKVREQKAATRTPRAPKAEDSGGDAHIPLVEGQENELTATLRREISALQARVAQLSEENQGLRAELALLKGNADHQA